MGKGQALRQEEWSDEDVVDDGEDVVDDAEDSGRGDLPSGNDDKAYIKRIERGLDAQLAHFKKTGSFITTTTTRSFKKAPNAKTKKAKDGQHDQDVVDSNDEEDYVFGAEEEDSQQSEEDDDEDAPKWRKKRKQAKEEEE